MADQDDEQKKLAMAPPDAAPKTALPVATIAPPGAPLPATPPQMAANASAPQLPGIAPPTALPAPAMPNPVAPPGMPQNNRIPSLPPPQIQSGGARLWDKASGVPGAPGVLAKIGAGIARAADVVGEGISPRIAALVPGSETNTRLQNKENEEKFERREQLDTQREGVEQKPEEAELAGEMRGKLQADRDSDAATRQQAALKQQADLAAQREKDAEAARTQTIGAAQARQDALFAQQQKLEGDRETARQRDLDARLADEDKRSEEKSTKEKVTADEQRRSDLSENLNENLDSLEDIVKRRPELFGPLAGRWAELKQKFGSDDPDLAKLQTIEHQIGMAQISAHGMRSAQGIEGATDSIMNHLHNGPKAMLAGVQAVRDSVKTFSNDVERKGGDAGKGPAPKRPSGVPGNAEWNAEARQWQLPTPPGK